MKFRVEIICVREDGAEQRRDVMEMERQQVAMENLGLSLAEGKAMLRGVQDFVASQQIGEDLTRRRSCPKCGQRHHSKGLGTSTVHTVFGPVAVPNPRWQRCSCQAELPKTFRPTATWLNGRTSPELLYLETKWGSLIPFEKVADLLKDVLPSASPLITRRYENICRPSPSAWRRSWAKNGSPTRSNPRRIPTSPCRMVP